MMDECHLDWKKVFKEILGDKSQSTSLEHAAPSSNIFHSEAKNSNESKLKRDLNSERTEHKFTEQKTKVCKNGIPTLNSNIFHSEAKNSYERLKRDLNNERPSDKFLKEKTQLCKKRNTTLNSNTFNSESKHSDESKLKSDFNNVRTENKFTKSKTHLRKNDNLQYINSCSVVEHTYSTNKSENVKVPEWNKVFKAILGSSSACDLQEQKNIDWPLKKTNTPKKHHVPVHSKRIYSKKKSCPISKNEMDAEIEKVTKIFASSRLLPPECYDYNLNDLAGSGVDIFKCDYKLTSCVKKTKSEVVYKDDSVDQYIKPDIPVGWVAKMKPLTTADVLPPPNFPLTEPMWDDDLLY